MKNGHEYTLTSDQQTQVLELSKECKSVYCFKLDGVIFVGESIEVTKRYIALNPSKSFYVWCHDNLPILTQTDTNVKP